MSMWRDRPADTLAPGDCVMIEDLVGWHPRIVQRVVPDPPGRVLVHFFPVRHADGDAVRCRAWHTTDTVPVFAGSRTIVTIDEPARCATGT